MVGGVASDDAFAVGPLLNHVPGGVTLGCDLAKGVAHGHEHLETSGGPGRRQGARPATGADRTSRPSRSDRQHHGTGRTPSRRCGGVRHSRRTCRGVGRWGSRVRSLSKSFRCTGRTSPTRGESDPVVGGAEPLLDGCETDAGGGEGEPRLQEPAGTCATPFGALRAISTSRSSPCFSIKARIWVTFSGGVASKRMSRSSSGASRRGGRRASDRSTATTTRPQQLLLLYHHHHHHHHQWRGNLWPRRGSACPRRSHVVIHAQVSHIRASCSP